MSTAIVQPRRIWLPATNLLLSVAAVVIAVIALAIVPAHVSSGQLTNHQTRTGITQRHTTTNGNEMVIDCRGHHVGRAC